MSFSGTAKSIRRPLVSGNWKMNLDHIEALHLVRDLGLRLKPEDLKSTEVSLHPPFSDIRTVQTLLEGEKIPVSLGAQHCSDQDRGPFTGEVSPQMLSRLGVRYVIVGHSERRELFHMSDEIVAQTLRAVVRNSMIPILCVGETALERDEGRTKDKLSLQLRTALEGLDVGLNSDSDFVSAFVVAYEPIWAIGTSQTPTGEEIEGICAFIREVLADIFTKDYSREVRVQYGGSVNASNARDILTLSNVDGLLVGGASLKASDFVDIIRAGATC